MEAKVKQISEYKDGETVNDLFAVRFKKPVRPTRSGGYFFELKLQDAKGDIMLKFWGRETEESIQEIYDSIKNDDIVKIENGKIGSYNGRMDISVNEGLGHIIVVKEGDYDPKDFIESSSRSSEDMIKEIEDMLGSISDGELKTVAATFLKDEEFMKKFVLSPAAMYKHHGWISGLLEHTLCVMNICNDITKYHEGLNHDLLLVGALIHDIGKIKEFEMTTTIKVSDTGNLLGHITLGVQMLTRKLDSLSISETTKQKLLHMMISHHGCHEHGSPKTPCFPEALLLSKVDELDAFITQMRSRKEDADTEDSFIYSKDFGNIYLK